MNRVILIERSVFPPNQACACHQLRGQYMCAIVINFGNDHDTANQSFPRGAFLAAQLPECHSTRSYSGNATIFVLVGSGSRIQPLNISI